MRQMLLPLVNGQVAWLACAWPPAPGLGGHTHNPLSDARAAPRAWLTCGSHAASYTGLLTRTGIGL